MTRIKFYKKQDRNVSPIGQAFGAALREARIAKELTHYEVSRQVVCSMTMYRDIEGGWLPELPAVVRLAGVLDLSLDAALGLR